eukprot:354077-Rhodomonas_salina.1
MHRRRSGMSIAATVLVARWCAFVAADRGNAGWRWVIDERGRQDCSAHRRVQASARLLRIRRQSGSWSRIHSSFLEDVALQFSGFLSYAALRIRVADLVRSAPFGALGPAAFSHAALRHQGEADDSEAREVENALPEAENAL